MKTTNVEKNNPGPASMVIVEDEREGLQVIGATIIAGDNIMVFPLKFPTESKSNICEFDADKKEERRKYDGKPEKADFSIMKDERNKRKEQGREIGIIVSRSEFERRKAEKEGKIENIEEYKASKKTAKVSGMDER